MAFLQSFSFFGLGPSIELLADFLRHHTLQDQTYETLRQWLTIGRFVPGERIKIRHVAAELGVGEMPVRSAFVAPRGRIGAGERGPIAA